MGTKAITRGFFLAGVATGAAIGLMMVSAPAAYAQQGTAANIQMRVQGAPDGSSGQASGDPLALYGINTGQRAPGVSYDEEENQRLREFERRRANIMRSHANGTASANTAATPSEREVRSGLVYSEEEDARLEAADQRQNERQQSIIDAEMTGGSGAGINVSDEAINRNLELVDPSAVQQADAFNQTVEDFQDDLGLLGGDENAECVMASSRSGCPMNENAIDASFQEGLQADITNPQLEIPGEDGGVIPISTTGADLSNPEDVLPEEFYDTFNQDTLAVTIMPGQGAFGPDGEPINMDDLSWTGYMDSEEERTMNYDKYLEYKVWGFDMSGFQWFGENRFLMPKNFFLREEMELGPRQDMVPQDRQIAFDDRLITFREYHRLINDRYNMSGTRYFGDDLGIQIYSRSSSRTCDERFYDDDDNRYREPWYCDTEAYELPLDFFERQDRNPGWQARLNYRGYNDDD